MSIDLKLPKASESVTVKYRLPKDIAEEFGLYVKAAQSQMPNADESLVLETLLKQHMKKDRSFRAWLKTTQINQNMADQKEIETIA